jgi:hypothetical protein
MAKNTKKCGKCKRIKLRSCFTKDINQTDGLCSICKECKRRYEREYIKAARQKRKGKFDIPTVGEATGIESESQIDSIIREIAELSANISQEKALCDHRISLIRKYTDENIEPLESHQIALQTMLLNFLKKQKIKRFFRGYRFGIVSFYRGKLKLNLFTDQAKQMLEKP